MKSLEKESITISLDYVKSHIQQMTPNMMIKMEFSIEEKGWSHSGADVGVAPVEDDGVDFEERMAEIHRELLALQAESNDLMNAISRNMKRRC